MSAHDTGSPFYLCNISRLFLLFYNYLDGKLVEILLQKISSMIITTNKIIAFFLFYCKFLGLSKSKYFSISIPSWSAISKIPLLIASVAISFLDFQSIKAK